MTGRRRRRRRRTESGAVGIRLDPLTGCIVYPLATEADIKCHLRYIERHELIPDGLEAWTARQLRSLVEATMVSATEEAWERALVLLAHHPSQTARDLLYRVQCQIPEALRGFWELAANESLFLMEMEIEPDGGAPLN